MIASGYTQKVQGKICKFRQLFQGDEYDLTAFENGSNFVINDHVEVFTTPGHTLDSVSVKVVTSKGVYVIAGDLFEKKDDLLDENIWKEAGSEDPKLQQENRDKVLKMADFIVPGHGPMFSPKK